MRDFNIYVKIKGNGYQKLEEFCDMFNLTNLVDTETCVTNSHKSTIDLMLTNKPSSSDCNGTQTNNHLVCKQTLNHLAKLAK